MNFSSKAMLASLALATLGVSQTHVTNCGSQFNLSLDTTFSIARGAGQRPEAVSITSVAPVVLAGKAKPVAWIVLDERGERWIALIESSPDDLKALWRLGKLDFQNNSNVKVRFSPLIDRLPPSYRLISCADLQLN